MLTMKWMMDHEGRLVATWEETPRPETAVCRSGFRETPQQPTLLSPARRVMFFVSLLARVWKLPAVFVGTLLLFGRASSAHATKAQF